MKSVSFVVEDFNNPFSQDLPQFVPHPLLRSGHAQTVYGYFAGGPLRSGSGRACRHSVRLPDGDILMLHVNEPARAHPATRVVLLIHGLGGCHASSYMERIAGKVAAAGFRSIRMDMRGCGAGVETARQSFHAGRSEDVREVLAYIARNWPQMPVTACGFSLGANLLLKTLGESAQARPFTLDSAIAVAPPVDLARCVAELRRSGHWVYDRFFVRLLWRDVRARRPLLANLERVKLDRRPRTLYEFDDRITAPLGGFSSASEYYQLASAGPLVSRIRVPTQILIARDDPLVPPDVVSRLDLSSSTRVYTTSHGGHLGFIGGRRAVVNNHPDEDLRWMDWRIIDWVRDADTCRARQPLAAPPSATVKGR